MVRLVRKLLILLVSIALCFSIPVYAENVIDETISSLIEGIVGKDLMDMELDETEENQRSEITGEEIPIFNRYLDEDICKEIILRLSKVMPAREEFYNNLEVGRNVYRDGDVFKFYVRVSYNHLYEISSKVDELLSIKYIEGGYSIWVKLNKGAVSLSNLYDIDFLSSILDETAYEKLLDLEKNFNRVKFIDFTSRNDDWYKEFYIWADEVVYFCSYSVSNKELKISETDYSLEDMFEVLYSDERASVD